MGVRRWFRVASARLRAHPPIISPLRPRVPPARPPPRPTCAAARPPPLAPRRPPTRYEFNGGTILAVAGDDYVVLGADTRLSTGYSILSRRVSKAVSLTSTCVIGSGGCYTDIQTLHKNLQIRSAMYKHDHACEMGSAQVAQLLSTTLYGRRFFPYYAFNIVAGIDAAGKGVVYTYDAIGSFEPKTYAAQGSGQKLIIPVLDNLVGHKNRLDAQAKRSLEDTVELVKDSFITAGERQINTGDAIELFLITKDGIETRVFELKKD